MASATSSSASAPKAARAGVWHERVSPTTWLIHLHRGKNVFNPTLVAELHTCLSAVEAEAAKDLDSGSAGACVVLVGNAKFFSNGLDLEWLGAHPSETPAFIASVHALLARMLVFPLPTVAAVTGHAFGAGAFLALSCDWRVQDAARGWMCFPEVDLGLALGDGFRALVLNKLPYQTARTAALLGKRFTGTEALAALMVDAVGDASGGVTGVLAKARALAEAAAPKVASAPHRANFGAIKAELHRDAIAGLVPGGAAHGGANAPAAKL